MSHNPNQYFLERARLERRLFWESTLAPAPGVWPNEVCIQCAGPATVRNLDGRFDEAETFWCDTHHEEWHDQNSWGGSGWLDSGMTSIREIIAYTLDFEARQMDEVNAQLEGWPTA